MGDSSIHLFKGEFVRSKIYFESVKWIGAKGGWEFAMFLFKYKIFC